MIRLGFLCVTVDLDSEGVAAVTGEAEVAYGLPGVAPTELLALLAEGAHGFADELASGDIDREVRTVGDGPGPGRGPGRSRSDLRLVGDDG